MTPQTQVGGSPRQHPSGTRSHRCRCSLPGLTGFTADRRGGTDAGHHRKNRICQMNARGAGPRGPKPGSQGRATLHGAPASVNSRSVPPGSGSPGSPGAVRGALGTVGNAYGSMTSTPPRSGLILKKFPRIREFRCRQIYPHALSVLARYGLFATPQTRSGRPRPPRTRHRSPVACLLAALAARRRSSRVRQPSVGA